jgi:hypothetical protein
MKLRDVLLGDVESPQNSLSIKDTHALLRVVALGIAGVVVNYLIELLPGIDFGQYSGLAVPVIMSLLEVARRYIATGQSQ